MVPDLISMLDAQRAGGYEADAAYRIGQYLREMLWPFRRVIAVRSSTAGLRTLLEIPLRHHALVFAVKEPHGPELFRARSEDRFGK